MYLILLQFTLVACKTFLITDNKVTTEAEIVVGSLRRREQIPLSQINRSYMRNLNYRKSRDIRDSDSRYIIDTHQEQGIDFDPFRDALTRNNVLRKQYDDKFEKTMQEITRNGVALNSEKDTNTFPKTKQEVMRMDYEAKPMNEWFNNIQQNAFDNIGLRFDSP